MKHQNPNNPSVDTGGRSDVWVSQHAFDVFHIDLDNKVAKANKI